MQSFKTLMDLLEKRFSDRIFPRSPKNLYAPAGYMLNLGGKRIRPVLCLMGNELFEELSEDSFKAAIAIELFHNFTLIHDDIMDEAPVRRGMPTVHSRFGSSNALLSGDVMLVRAYETICDLKNERLPQILKIFNRTAKEVCEGQQLDMDLARLPLRQVAMKDYLTMITLKTSVLLAASLQIGGEVGGGSEADLNNLYGFGKNVGIAFQIQDDYLDAFGEYEKFGKQIGGDILANKKTFLLIKAFELADTKKKSQLLTLLDSTDKENKIKEVIRFYKNHEIDVWARKHKDQFIRRAEQALEAIQVPSVSKKGLLEVMKMLLDRER